MTVDPRPCMLVILDGWGLSSAKDGNAVAAAATPTLDGLRNRYPCTSLACSGEAVGLPAGIMGNSEVGHLNIGAGRIVCQDLLRIDRAIEDGSFFENPVLVKAATTVASTPGAALHLIGLVSDGGVHSQLSHLSALVNLAKKFGVKKVRVHAILDGRDTPPRSGIRYIKQLEAHLKTDPAAEMASICGRFYAMDRDTRWERIEKAYRLYTRGEGRGGKDPETAVAMAYDSGETDEFVEPIVLTDEAERPKGVIQDRDAVVFFNFRADRAREMTRAFIDDDFDFFKRSPRPKLSSYVCMTLYDEMFALPAAFPPVRLKRILGEVVSQGGLQQLRIAETEKYAHVTYFFNGGDERPFDGEDRCLVPSPRDVKTYDLRPEMSAPAVTEALLSRIGSGVYHFIVVNFANMDMVGHTGNFDAAVKACQAVDTCLGRILKAWTAAGGTAMVTSDHGNAEKMLETDGTRHTAHTTHPVPFILVDPLRRNQSLRSEGLLADIAPTALALMGLNRPDDMTGRSLLK